MMKKLIILSLAAILSSSCKGQEGENIKEDKDSIAQVQPPQGTWKVDKEFDENGNLIRYDSIYSWSSEDFGNSFNHNPDSLLKSFRSGFYRHFSGTDNFGNLFPQDSLFTRRFFDEDFFDSEFGQDFMDIDRVRQRMERMQQRFLERYHSHFEEREDALNDSI